MWALNPDSTALSEIKYGNYKDLKYQKKTDFNHFSKFNHKIGGSNLASYAAQKNVFILIVSSTYLLYYIQINSYLFIYIITLVLTNKCG